MASYNSHPDIMNVREIIDAAFGDFDGNAVNFKLIQTVLHLIARQMRLLERRVEVDLGPLAVISSGSTLSVTEVKIHAMQKKRRKTKDEIEKGAGGKRTNVAGGKSGVGGKTSGGEKSGGGGKGRKSDRTTGTSSSDKTSTDKTSSDKASTDKAFSDKASTYKTSSDKTSTDKTSTDKTSSDRTTTDKTFSDRTTTDKTSSDRTATDKTSSDRTATDKTSSDRTTTDKTSSDRTTTDKTSSDRTTTDKTSSDRTATDRTSSDRTATDKTSSDRTATDKTSSDRTATDKTSSDRTATDKTSSHRTATDKTSSDRTTTDKTSSDKTTTDKASSDRTTTDKTSSDRTATDKTSLDRTARDKTSSHKTATDKTSSDITTIDKTYSDKTSTDKTTSDKISTDRTSSDKISIDRTSTDETSTDKTSSSRTTSSSKDKSSSKSSSGKSADRQAAATARADKIPEKIRETSEERTSKRGGKGKKSSKRAPADADDDTQAKHASYPDILETLEIQKERELRVIHQRADSFEETIKSPTPMASIGSMEAQYEKVLVVKRVPSIEARRSAESIQGQSRTPQISVVTQEQFEQLAEIVRQLQNRLLPVGTPGFPERAQLMEELRRGASLTDAMAALQLSARLEATEKAIGNMVSMVTELAKQTPGVEIDFEAEPLYEFPGGTYGGVGAFEGGAAAAAAAALVKSGGRGGGGRGAKGAKGAKGTRDKSTKDTGGIEQGLDFGIVSQKAEQTPQKAATAYSQTSSKSQEREGTATLTMSEKSVESIEMTPVLQPAIAPTSIPGENEFALKTDFITYQELKIATKEMYDHLINSVTAITTRAKTSADQAYKLSLSLDGKIEAALAVSSRMNDLENMVGQYADQINALDTGLSSQMTNYQEQLTQMQHDLEIGLETMAEVLGNTGGDTVAVTELNSHFTNLQLDFDNMMYRQKDLKDAQDSISYDLENLWKEIEMLRDTKSDREEVVDALRDKAGIGELNGLVSLQQFDAVRGDFEKRIRASYDKFNNQEHVWQKAIDDLVRVLEEKADIVQVESLKDEINKYLNIMKGRMQSIIDIVGEPKSAMLSKKLFRNTACLSCGSPAHMDCEEPGLVPALPKLLLARQPAEGAEAEPKVKGDGDHRICYPNYPIPHPRDPRSHVCQRYCGGSHTLLTEGPSRVPPAMVIHQPSRVVNTELGTDGKVYLVDEQSEKVPCLPCNMPKPTPPSLPEQVNEDSKNPDSNANVNNEPVVEDICETPPAHQIEI